MVDGLPILPKLGVAVGGLRNLVLPPTENACDGTKVGVERAAGAALVMHRIQEEYGFEVGSAQQEGIWQDN